MAEDGLGQLAEGLARTRVWPSDWAETSSSVTEQGPVWCGVPPTARLQKPRSGGMDGWASLL